MQDKSQLIISSIKNKHNFCSDCRVHNLVYLAEILYLERNGCRLTDLCFKPYRYGVYSEEIRRILDYEDDIEVKQEKFEELSELVVNLTKYISDEELISWVKTTYLFKTTSYNDNICFNNYMKYLDDGNASDWKKLI